MQSVKNDPSRLTRWRRISVRSLFVITALCAALLGAWRAFIYEPPTHRLPLYEKAPSTQKLAARVGPNTISIKSVARNRSDGSLVIETGAGARLGMPVPQSDRLAACSTWMDVAQIELQPGVDRFEIIEARIFEHTTRTILSRIDPVFGWQVVGNNLLQVYGVGKELPASLDVWLRVHSYDGQEEAGRLAPISGSTVSIPGGTISLTAIQNGFAGWNSATGFAPLGENSNSQTAIVLSWTGTPQEPHYQIATVSVRGEKQFHDRILDVSRTGERKELVVIDFPLDEVAHFELRPHGGRHRFFFEAVQLPDSTGGRKFDPPPIVRLPISGKKIQTVLREFAPLKVRVGVAEGRSVTGVSSTDLRSHLHATPDPGDVDKLFTISYGVQGIAGLPLSIELVGPNSDRSLNNTVSRTDQYWAAGIAHQVSAEAYSIPMSQVEAIDISVSKPR